MTTFSCNKFNINLINNNISGDGFKIQPGEIIYMYGLSESGMSDLLLLFAGLHNLRGLTKPTDGKKLIREPNSIPIEDLSFLQLLEKPLYEYSYEERARNIGTIFENPDLYILGRDVLEDFYFTHSSLGLKLPDLRVLKQFGLYEKVYRKTDQLSGGEKHRLNCASIFTLSPKLIIADFSYSNLDSEFISYFYELIKTHPFSEISYIIYGLPNHTEMQIESRKFVLDNNQLKEKEPDPTEFPSVKEEEKIIRDLYKNRTIIDSEVLNVNSLGRLNRITQPVSFSMKRNEILQIWGPNGCGKTSVGKILIEILKEYVGTFHFNGVRPSISMQNPERQFIDSKIIKEMPDESLLELAGIKETEYNSHPLSLSRSKQKLLSIILAFSRSKEFVILDEPTSGMDFPAKKLFINILNHFNSHSVLIFTHDESLQSIGKLAYWKDIVV